MVFLSEYQNIWLASRLSKKGPSLQAPQKAIYLSGLVMSKDKNPVSRIIDYDLKGSMEGGFSKITISGSYLQKGG